MKWYNISMKTVDYLREIYGYGVPIFLKDIRIGRKSKTAIRKDLSRAVETGDISRKSQGIYYFSGKEGFPSTVSFDDIVYKKYISDDYGFTGLNLDVYGYYSGQTFLNQIGISQQVPAIVEITTNNTSCKREFVIGKRKAILRKGKTEINRFNYKALQFFEMFSYLSDDEVEENKELIEKYIANNLSRQDFERYIQLFGTRTIKIIVEKGFIHAFR